MGPINESQEKLLNKLDKINLKNFHYFCSFNYTIGYGLLKYLKNKKDIIFIFKYFLKELANIFLMNDYELIKNRSNNFSFKKIIFTWGNQSNLDNGVYNDSYFKKKSSEDLNLLWVVLYRGRYNRKQLERFKNVNFIIERKKNIISKFFNFCKIIYNFFKLKKKI